MLLNDFLNDQNRDKSREASGLEAFGDVKSADACPDGDVAKASLEPRAEPVSQKTKHLCSCRSKMEIRTHRASGSIGSVLAQSSPQQLAGRRTGVFSHGLAWLLPCAPSVAQDATPGAALDKTTAS